MAIPLLGTFGLSEVVGSSVEDAAIEVVSVPVDPLASGTLDELSVGDTDVAPVDVVWVGCGTAVSGCVALGGAPGEVGVGVDVGPGCCVAVAVAPGALVVALEPKVSEVEVAGSDDVEDG